MKVKLLVDISGSRNGEPWPKRGEVVDLPDAEAVHMCGARLAEAVQDVEHVEKAVAPAPAKAAAKQSRQAAAKRQSRSAKR